MTVHPICQSVFEKAFPASADAEVVRAVTEGVLLADDLIAHTPFLATPVGKNLRGLMRRAGVMYRFHDLCELGDLPFQTSMVRMEKGSWHCLEIAAVSRSPSPTTMVRRIGITHCAPPMRGSMSR
jgi:hypothetical protein